VDLKGRWALVTGASRGIGKLVATDLAQKGCKVILHSRKLLGTKDLLLEIKASGGEAYSVEGELSKWEEVEKLIKKVRELTDNHLDVLYNNAAIMTPWRDTYDPRVEEYAESFMVNTIVPAKLCDAFIPIMIKNGFGRVVNVTSGIECTPQLMPYSCSKAALDRYVRDLEPSLKGTNVLLNLLDPGWLQTDLGGSEAPNKLESVLPGAIVPVLLEEDEGSGKLYRAQDYAK